MKAFLKFVFGSFAVLMLAMSTWASLHCPLFAIPRTVATHPWFLATTADAYFAFTTLGLWMAYKQTCWTAKISWFLASLLLGNIATGAYCLAELILEPREAPISDLLVRRREGPGLLGIVLAVAGIAVTVLGAVTA